MPVLKDREYRTMAPLAAAQENKRFQSDFYVEGYATTFDSPYLLYEYDGVEYFEMIERGALQNADLSDVIMQYDHAGTVFARNMMAKGKYPCLLVEPQEQGLFIAADLGVIDAAKQLYESIAAGLVYKMSWAFKIAEDRYDHDTRTRIITKIKKVYDVSAVSYPANGDTDIAARSYIDGVIGVEKREALARQALLLTLKIKMEV